MSCPSGRRPLRLFFIRAAFWGSLSALSLLVCLALFVPEAQGAPTLSVRVTLPPVLRTADSAFTLGEVAGIEGPQDAKEALSALLLSEEGGVLTREQVLQAIRASGLEGVRVELTMPAVVRVEPSAPEGSGAQVTPALRSDVSLSSMIKSLAGWGGTVEVVASGPVPEGRLVAPASMVPGTPAATLRFQDKAGRLRSLAVRMTWHQDVQVAARTLQRGRPIRPQDLMTRRVQIARPGVYAERAEQALGFIPRRTLNQGEPVLLELLTSPTLVRKGRPVKVVARLAGLTATAEGVLLDDGEPGDVVRVRRTDRKNAVLEARIIDENTVEVTVP